MYIVPLLRINRALAATLICPEDPIKAVAVSEIVSVIGPMLNPKIFSRIIAYTVAFMYQPMYASAIIDIYKKNDYIYYQAELCCLLLFVISLLIQNI